MAKHSAGLSGDERREGGVALRAARWSATHRKAAILGWIGFVLVALAAGQMVTQQKLTLAEGTAGEAGRAERALDDAGLRPTSEVVMVQSKTQTIDDPGFEAAVKQVSGRLSDTAHVRKLRSPLTGDAAVSADRRSALIEFEIVRALGKPKDLVVSGVRFDAGS